ncbi:MAG TPA: hypothetical protein VKY85_20265 [Candidatus Angelobacter sp.]|nr:hypothetical protein [Candidatus Angelobacter sp.]
MKDRCNLMGMPEQGFENVHVVHEYWDGPRTGIADYGGRPHWFENVFDQEQDDYSEVYWLTPLSDNALRLARQQVELFFRWRQAFGKGEVDLSTHSVLPEDRATYERLGNAIRLEVASNANTRFKTRGHLKRLGAPLQPGTISDFQVKWDTEE